jgi:hypothetical protein
VLTIDRDDTAPGQQFAQFRWKTPIIDLLLPFLVEIVLELEIDPGPITGTATADSHRDISNTGRAEHIDGW